MPRIAVAASLLMLVAACSPKAQEQPLPVARFVVVKTQAVQLTASLPGRTAPTAVSEVHPQVNGIIKARLFTEGSTVKLGHNVKLAETPASPSEM